MYVIEVTTDQTFTALTSDETLSNQNTVSLYFTSLPTFVVYLEYYTLHRPHA